jgi:hypothetical protein
MSVFSRFLNPLSVTIDGEGFLLDDSDVWLEMEELAECCDTKIFRVRFASMSESTFQTFERFVRIMSPKSLIICSTKEFDWKRFVLATEGTSVANLKFSEARLESWMVPSQVEMIECESFAESGSLPNLHTLCVDYLDEGLYDHISHLKVYGMRNLEGMEFPNLISLFLEGFAGACFSTEKFPSLKNLTIAGNHDRIDLRVCHPLEFLDTTELPAFCVSVKKIRHYGSSKDHVQIFKDIPGLEQLILGFMGKEKRYGVKSLVELSS